MSHINASQSSRGTGPLSKNPLSSSKPSAKPKAEKKNPMKGPSDANQTKGRGQLYPPPEDEDSIKGGGGKPKPKR